ncbi:MAG: hypothetical protein ACD_75C00516G0003 [uncultured bacterium]|nr:MAG: hypothetical protein ACD_75C00516G0003 [uncultured bacterium]
MNEAETRAEYFDPSLKAAGWVWTKAAASGVSTRSNKVFSVVHHFV